MTAAVTVYTSLGGQPINKLVRRLSDGTINKGLIEHRQHYAAETRIVPDLKAMAALLRDVGRHPDQAISLSVFVDPPAPRWHTWSASRMARFLGCSKDDRAVLAGWHDVGSGVPTCVRMKENMRQGGWLLFDRDAAEGMARELADLNCDDWCLAVDSLWPGFATCGKVLIPSTSTRVLVDGAPLASNSWHAFVLVDDLELIAEAWAHAFERCAITSFSARPWEEPVLLGFAKPRRLRATGQVCGRQLWTVYDRSTWATNRLVFDGCPTVEGAGLTLTDLHVHVIDGPPLEMGAVKAPTARVLKAIRAATNAITGHDQKPERSYAVNGKGRAIVTGTTYVIPDLAEDLAVDTGAGEMTVREFWESDLDHVRCQTPYRDSTSFAAFLGKHKDDTPFLFDSGTNERHVLDRALLRQRMWQLIILWIEEDYAPSFGYQDGGVFSRSLGRKILPRDIHETPTIIDRLAMASDAPCSKDGGLNRLALPTEFHKWLKVAWGALLHKLPSESVAEMTEEGAIDTLPVQVGALLNSLVQSDDPTPWGSARRAVGTWCHWYALQRPGHWSRVGSLQVWGRIKGGVFQIALTKELARQVSASQHAAIAGMTKAKFTKRCNRYGITAPENHIGDGSGELFRGVILSAQFVSGLDLYMEHRDMRGEAIRNAVGLGAESDLSPTGRGEDRVH